MRRLTLGEWVAWPLPWASVRRCWAVPDSVRRHGRILVFGGSSSREDGGSASSEKASRSRQQRHSASSASAPTSSTTSRQTSLPRPAPRRSHHLKVIGRGSRRRLSSTQQRVSACGANVASIWSTETHPRNLQRLVGNLGYSCHVVGPAGTCGSPTQSRPDHTAALSDARSMQAPPAAAMKASGTLTSGTAAQSGAAAVRCPILLALSDAVTTGTAAPRDPSPPS